MKILHDDTGDLKQGTSIEVFDQIGLWLKRLPICPCGSDKVTKLGYNYRIPKQPVFKCIECDDRFYLNIVNRRIWYEM